MRKALALVAGVATLALAVTGPMSTAFAGPGEQGHGNPFHGVNQQGSGNPFAGSGNLTYHSGGSVQTGTHHTYAIYWGSSFSTNYKSIINGYFGNVAAASGSTSNVYYSDTQYY